jgi:Mg-chelatase subunit ChlD
MMKKIGVALILVIFLIVPSFSGNLDVKFKSLDTSGFPLVVSTFEVMDEDGAYVRNIFLNNVHVAENMEVIQNVRIESDKKRTNIVFVLDNSKSMKKYYREMKKDYFSIINLLDKEDRVGVVQLKGKPNIIQKLTKDKFKAVEKLSRIKKFGRADVFTGLKKAFDMLIEKNGGKEIILITDSMPTISKLSKKRYAIYEGITHKMRTYGIRLHIIALGHEAIDDEIMDKMTLETGGLKLLHPNPHHLKYDFKKIIYSVPSRFKFAYISPQSNGRGGNYSLCVKVNSKLGSGKKSIQFRP